MRKLFISFLLVFVFISASAQVKIYNPDADAEKELSDALTKAKEDNKHVFIQVGGNWCPWCVKLHNFMKEEAQVDSMLHANYVVMKLNYSSENKNPELMKRLGYPQRFGFPVIVILDAEGNRIHTQNSAYLELDKGYDKQKIMGFLKDWSPAALNPEKYK
ncbi:MAG: hypothetical protein A2W91_10740 [Bacteroidetes bacterium GWF2_38_335]|nr:MAG: hypothetical protein A2W91_10740 [Bacteroidetes bacterium GWF2_38_335]OFY81821.1 MAG: hypothetical protein A2281_06300 [Bacteroidetes bacterium RIFOXYA12_FULL_38_20]HBS87894.1 thioredoxin family protein [Bacteroidales bacterium]